MNVVFVAMERWEVELQKALDRDLNDLDEEGVEPFIE
jgi:hypothetical protein